MLCLSVCLLNGFSFHSCVLHFSLFQVPGTPHSGCPTDGCAALPEMTRVLMAFPISPESDHHWRLLPCYRSFSRMSHLLWLRVTAVWPVFLSSSSSHSTSFLTEFSSYSFLSKAYGLWKLFLKKNYSFVFFLFSLRYNAHCAVIFKVCLFVLHRVSHLTCSQTIRVALGFISLFSSCFWSCSLLVSPLWPCFFLPDTNLFLPFLPAWFIHFQSLCNERVLGKTLHVIWHCGSLQLGLS